MQPIPVGLDHVTFQVPEPEAAAEFCAAAFGLAITSRRPGGAVTLSSLPRNAVVVPDAELVFVHGEVFRLDHMAFALPGDTSLEQVEAHLRSQGFAAQRVTCALSEGEHVRVAGPDGAKVDLAPQRPLIRRPPGEAPFGIVRLGHITLSAPEPPALVEFLIKALRFRLSDHSGSDFYWLRCNRDHHGVGCKRGAAGVNHIAFELENWQEVQRACDHLRSEGLETEFGPGRHGPGNNIFTYVRTPFGLRFELFCDLVRIDDDGAYQPRDWGSGGGQSRPNTWGPAPPESYRRG